MVRALATARMVLDGSKSMRRVAKVREAGCV